MIITVSISKAPSQLRGHLTKWLFEIQRGTYVGKTSATVADLLWKQIKEALPAGRAIMVKTTNNEQGFTILEHHHTWHPVDRDGLILISKPVEQEQHNTPPTGWSTNAKRLKYT